MFAPVAAGVMWDFLPHCISFPGDRRGGRGLWIEARTIRPADLGQDRPEDRPRCAVPPRRHHAAPSNDDIGAISASRILLSSFVVILSSARIASARTAAVVSEIPPARRGLEATAVGLFVTLSQLRRQWARYRRRGSAASSRRTGCSSRGDDLDILDLFDTALRQPVRRACRRHRRARLCPGRQPAGHVHLLSEAVTREAQATSIGLGATATVSPPWSSRYSWAVAQFWGLHATFYVTGAVLL